MVRCAGYLDGYRYGVWLHGLNVALATRAAQAAAAPSRQLCPPLPSASAPAEREPQSRHHNTPARDRPSGNQPPVVARATTVMSQGVKHCIPTHLAEKQEPCHC